MRGRREYPGSGRPKSHPRFDQSAICWWPGCPDSCWLAASRSCRERTRRCRRFQFRARNSNSGRGTEGFMALNLQRGTSKHQIFFSRDLFEWSSRQRSCLKIERDRNNLLKRCWWRYWHGWYHRSINRKQKCHQRSGEGHKLRHWTSWKRLAVWYS